MIWFSIPPTHSFFSYFPPPNLSPISGALALAESTSMSIYKNLCNSFFIILFFVVPMMNSISFNIPRFEPQTRNIILEGDAATSIGTIELINRYMCRAGRATYAEQVPLWDSSPGGLAHFTTHFTFSIQKSTPFYGAGLAFFIAPVGHPIPSNSPGGFLGLFNTTTTDDTSLNRIIHVEFDSSPNPEWDPDFTHVGINKYSIKSAAVTYWNASMHSQETGNAWITYNATTKNLSVYWTYDKNPVYQGESLLSYQVDLKQILPEKVTIGFSAATSATSGRHILYSWDFNSTLEIQEKKSTKCQHDSWIICFWNCFVSSFFTCGVDDQVEKTTS
ncbi:hypothetical protein C5167_029825 [Papaver somniferum]|nr:hypothetical protein C5167_029825 [Papaver somniferum]